MSGLGSRRLLTPVSCFCSDCPCRDCSWRSPQPCPRGERERSAHLFQQPARRRGRRWRTSRQRSADAEPMIRDALHRERVRVAAEVERLAGDQRPQAAASVTAVNRHLDHAGHPELDVEPTEEFGEPVDEQLLDRGRRQRDGHLPPRLDPHRPESTAVSARAASSKSADRVGARSSRPTSAVWSKKRNGTSQPSHKVRRPNQ